MNEPLSLSRRDLLGQMATGIGATALAIRCSLPMARALDAMALHFARRPSASSTCFSPGAPSQMDLFDHKPKLADLRGTELPDRSAKASGSTGMTSRQTSFPVAPSRFQFAQHGKCGAWSASCCRTRRKSPTTCASSGRCTPRRSTTTRRSRSSRPARNWPAGRASARGCATAWAARTSDLPAFVVMSSSGTGNPSDQPLYDRLWGSGFLPSKYQGVKFRSVGDPVLLPVEPAGHRRGRAPRDARRSGRAQSAEAAGEPATRKSPRASRSTRWPSACRPRVPELTDLSNEPRARLRPVRAGRRRSPARYASNCLLARRLAERGVRFVQLFHRGWDQHTQPAQADRRPVPRHRSAVGGADRGSEAARPAGRHAGRLGRRVRPHGLLPGHAHRRRLRPRPSPALLHDLAGRRRHQAGFTYGETDDFCYNIAATRSTSTTCTPRCCTCLGIDHTRLTFKYQGRHYRLTDVHGNVVQEVLS